MNIVRNALQSELDALIQQLDRIARIDGDFPTAIPALTIYRRSAATKPMPYVYGMGLGITVQGSKTVTQGNQVFDYGPGQALVTSIDMPVAAHISKGTSVAPYLGIRLDFDLQAITQFADAVNFSAPNKIVTARAMSVLSLDQGLLDAVARLIRLLAEPKLVPVLAPLIQQEIIARLLLGPHGSVLHHLVAAGTPGGQIAKTIAWLKRHYAEHIPIDSLAANAHMSPSTFREHFRAVAGISPLQYLKQLRLQGARQLMLNKNVDANNAALLVGYESASQFSREYSRLYGEPPRRDIQRMRGVEA